MIKALLPSKPILAIDFDGTIVESRYPEIGPEVKNATKTINILKELGFSIIINTCRHSEVDVLAAKNKLEELDLQYDYFNENHPELIKLYGDSRKLGADMYIDDKNLDSFINWEVIFLNIMDAFNINGGDYRFLFDKIFGEKHELQD